MSDSKKLKIGILSCNPKLYSTKRLLEAAKERGHSARVVDYSKCYLKISSGNPAIYQGDKALKFDAVIPRIGTSMTFYGTAVVRQFEMTGTFCANGSQAIARARDKLRTLQILSSEGIGLPDTSISRSPKDIDAMIAAVGGAPLVVKLIEGTQGVGVVLAETKKAAESVIGAFRQLDANILAQAFVKEANGADIRAFVVDGKVVASMKRQGPEGEFRSNLHRGGSASAINLSKEERATAVKSAKSLGLRLAGVDMLQSENGPVVMEVNSSPGLEGIEGSTEVDVAGKIIAMIEKHSTPGAKGGRNAKVEG